MLAQSGSKRGAVLEARLAEHRELTHSDLDGGHPRIYRQRFLLLQW